MLVALIQRGPIVATVMSLYFMEMDSIVIITIRVIFNHVTHSHCVLLMIPILMGLGGVFKLILAIWRSQPMRKRLREPITVRIRIINLKPGLSCPCNHVDGGISRLGDGRLSGPGCLCPDGYESDIDSGDLCVDIDECNDFKHDCDWKADCVNIEASFDCVCKDGYQGDGYHCTDVDECLGPE